VSETNSDINGYGADSFQNGCESGNINSNANGATNGSGGHESPGLLAGLAADVASQGMRVPQDLSLVAQLAETRLHGGLINDRKYLVCLD